MLGFARILFVVGGLFAPAAAVAASPDEDACASTPASTEVVAACSQLIEGTTKPAARAFAFTLRARAKSDLGDLADAVADYSAALTLFPKYDAALNGRASAYSRLKNYDRALRDSTQAIGLKPDNAEYYNTRGLTYRGMGDPTKALADFDQAIKLMPNYAIAFNNRGTAHNDLR
ncbi:MAG: tetratricopeptide repeat protein, partial [Xanthobacteraceae bacterium]